ncbi:hypothetical protein D3C80_1300620 [compost metagenome]
MQAALLVQAGQGDGHRGGGDDAAEQCGDQQAVAGADQADRHIGGETQAGDQHHHPPDDIGVERLPGAVALVGQGRQQHQGDEQQLQHPRQFRLAESAQGAVQGTFEAQEQGHRHRAGGGQGRMSGDCQAAEDEGDQHRHFAGQAAVA